MSLFSLSDRSPNIVRLLSGWLPRTIKRWVKNSATFVDREADADCLLDPSQILNLSMFEQNGNCGYVLKPSVFRDKEHPQYGRFNPTIMEREGACSELTLTVRTIRGTICRLTRPHHSLDHLRSVLDTKYWLNNECLHRN